MTQIRVLNAQTGEYVIEEVTDDLPIPEDPPQQQPTTEDRLKAIEDALINLMG